MNSMKREKDRTPEDEPPGRYMSKMLLEKSREIAPERIKRLGQGRNFFLRFSCGCVWW